MKTSRLLLVAGLLAGTVSFLSAGPGPQFWNRPTAPKPATTTIADTQANPMTAMCATCACCKKA